MFRLNSDKGYVSLLMLIVIVFLAGIGFNALYKANSQEKIIRYEADKVKAVFLADSGLEWAKASLLEDREWQGGTRFFTNGSIQVEAKKTTEGYCVMSVAQTGGARQIRYGDFIEKEDDLVLIRYRELSCDAR
ncbi:MAG: hypothetical protein GX351_03585 [Peptococcaceae bacterium]|nr:hypothetical protein [Peptococcaceae bacterium]